MDRCSSYAAQFRDGEHRLEPVKFETYSTEYRCLDCGETIVQHEAGHGG